MNILDEFDEADILNKAFEKADNCFSVYGQSSFSPLCDKLGPLPQFD